MSENISQLYSAQPTYSMQDNDLLYLGRSPYDTADDFAILWSNMVASISAALMTTVTVTETTQAVSVATRYISENALQTTFTLPITFNAGDIVIIKGLGSGGWVVQANTGTIIIFGDVATSSGGSMTTSNQCDTVQLSGLVANTSWSVDYAVTKQFTLS